MNIEVGFKGDFLKFNGEQDFRIKIQRMKIEEDVQKQRQIQKRDYKVKFLVYRAFDPHYAQ